MPHRRHTAIKDLVSWNKYSAKSTAKFKGETPFTFNAELNSKLALWRGDITQLKVGAIVNAANKTLLGGGGVDGAIHNAAGINLYYECKRLNGCDTGDAKITKGYCLPAKHVIHTVGPTGDLPNKEKLLDKCYQKCLQLCLESNIKSIAFPCISTGIYGYDNKEAAHVALKCVRNFLEKYGSEFELVVFCLFLQKDVEIYNELCNKYFPTAEASTASGSSVDNICDQTVSNDPEDNKLQKEAEESNHSQRDLSVKMKSKSSHNAASVLDNKENDYKEKKKIQKDLKKELSLKDSEPWMNNILKDGCPGLKYVGGLDMSIHKTKEDIACACLVVLNIPELQVVYKNLVVVDVTEKYKSGFLAFREIPHYKQLIKELKETKPDIMPQVVLVDGHGTYHPEKFGSACHLGVKCDIPTIGIGKNFLEIPEMNIRKENYKELKNEDYEIKHGEGDILAHAIKNCKKRHIYISPGHKISLKTACQVVRLVSRSRIPEPIRQADMLSGEELRNKFTADYEKYYEGRKKKKTTYL